MERVKRFFKSEGGHGALEVSTVLGFVATAILIALFIINAGGAILGA